jgi:hypothetical protein
MQPTSWPNFRSSDWTQLNKYNKETMFGQPKPCPPDPNTIILPWVWTYLYKIDPTMLKDVEKSPGTCNGGTRYGKVVTLAETYAVCVEQSAHRLTWSLIAALNYVGLGCDVSNAFAEAPPPPKRAILHGRGRTSPRLVGELSRQTTDSPWLGHSHPQ